MFGLTMINVVNIIQVDIRVTSVYCAVIFCSADIVPQVPREQRSENYRIIDHYFFINTFLRVETTNNDNY